MFFWFLLIAIILILRAFVVQMPKGMTRKKTENKFCQLVWLIIILMAAFRSPNVGADTKGYISDYLSMSSYQNFHDLNEDYKGYLGYYYTNKIFSMLNMPLQVWFGFVEALYAFALYRFVKRFSNDKLFSILIFVTSGLFSFSMAGLKQVMSMSLIMLAFLSFLDKKYIRMLFYTAAAYLCHPAGLIFLAASPLYLLRNKKPFIPMIFVTSFFCNIYDSQFLSTLVDVLSDEHYETYLVNDNSYTSTTLIFYFVVLALSYWGYSNYRRYDSNMATFVFGMSLLVCMLQSLASTSPNMFRLALCYTPFLMIMLPNAAYYYKSKQLGWIIIGCVVFFFLYVNRNTPYSFVLF